MINRLLGVVYEQSDICQSETAVFSCSCCKPYFGGEDDDVGLDVEAVCASMNVFFFFSEGRLLTVCCFDDILDSQTSAISRQETVISKAKYLMSRVSKLEQRTYVLSPGQGPRRSVDFGAIHGY